MKFKKREVVIIIFLNIVILIIGILQLNGMFGLTIGVDDFGYLGMAAQMSGTKWNEFFSNISYYSFGYSLILFPIFWICNQPIIIFKIAILLNVLMLIISFNISYACFLKLHKNEKKEIVILECFCATLYTSNFVYSHFVLTELLLYLLFWMVFFLILKIAENGRYTNIIFLSVLICYMYFVHQRALVIVMSVFAYLLLLLWQNKIKWKHMVVFALCFGILFIVGQSVKEFFINNLYVQNDTVGVNNLSGQVKKFEYLFSVEGVIVFINEVLAKLFYFLTATLFTGGLALKFLIERTVYNLKNEKAYLKNSYDNVYFFLLFGFVLAILMQAFFLIYPDRFDMVIYGRYIEFLLGPIIIIGMHELYKNSNLKNVLIILIITYICSRAAVFLFNKFELKPGISYLAPGLFTYFSKNYSLTDATYFSLQSAVFIVGYIYIVKTVIERKFHLNAYFFVLITLMSVWMSNTYNARKNILEDQKVLREEYYPIVENIQSSDKKIGFIVDEGEKDEKRIRQLQFLLMDKKIERLNLEQMESYEGKYLVIISKGTDSYQKVKMKKRVYENYRYLLIEM